MATLNLLLSLFNLSMTLNRVYGAQVVNHIIQVVIKALATNVGASSSNHQMPTSMVMLAARALALLRVYSFFTKKKKKKGILIKT